MKNKKIIYLILFLSLTMISLSNVTFESITTENELSSDEIMCVTQDKNSFLWIGTKTGLNRYDGCEFKIYKEEKGGLNNAYINTLYMDKMDNLWIGTGIGLSKFNLKNRTIKNYTAEDGFEENQMVMDIIEGKDGIIWFVSREKGLTKFIEKESKFIKINEISKDATSIAKDSNNNLWVGTYNGLFKVNEKTEKIDSNLLLDEWIQDTMVDKNDYIWITAKNKGISKYNDNTKDMKHYKLNNNNEDKKIDSLIRSVTEDRDGNIWVGTASEGVLILNIKNGIFKRYYYQSEDNRSLPGNSITNIYHSIEEITWITTNGSGLAKYDKNKNKFVSYKNNRKNPNSLKKGKVTAIYENNKGDLWIGLYDNGISKLEAGLEKFKHYNKDLNSELKISSDRVFSLLEVEVEDELWVGTAGGGLDIFNLNTGEKENYKDGERGFRAKNNTAFRIYKDSKGIIWVGSYYSGINKYDRKTKSFKNYQHNEKDKNSLSQNTIDVIFEDSNGFIWIGTDNGLNKFNPQTEKFIHYFREKEDKNTISSNIALSINEDKQKNLWIGQYHGGLNKMNLKTGNVTRYGQEEGLPDLSVESILFDKKNNIWFGTKTGLCKFNPVLGIIQEFTKKDGLQSNQFYMDSKFKNKKGEMYFGGINGFNKFNPENIKKNNMDPEIRLTEFITINREIKGIEFRDSIRVMYKENSFKVRFVALNYSDLKKQRYRYKITNKDNKWTNLGKSHFLTFSQMKTGKYLLEIQTTKTNGEWNKKGVKLKIIILPPWWNTWEAYLIYIFILFVVILILRKIEVQDQKRKFLEKEKKNMEELLKIRTMFLANMSHEIRTPMSSILGIIELLDDSEMDKKNKRYIKLINYSGEMLLSIVNNVLDISKLNSGELVLEKSEINIDEILKEVIMMFEIEVDQRKLNLEYKKNIKIDNYLIGDSIRIKQIFINLVKNAIKFTQKGGIELILKEKEILGNRIKLDIMVKDSGIGLKKSEMKNLFIRYKQANEKISKNYGGTGLGLNIAKRFAELMNGDIKVESEIGKGTTFIVQIELEIGDKKDIDKKQEKKEKEEKEEKNIEKKLEGKKIRVLVVEDDEINRKIIAEILRRIKIENKVVENGKKALDEFKENKYDFVLTDFHMPEMNGIELAGKVKNIDKNIKVILLSADNDAESDDIDYFLKKPLEKEKIERILLEKKKTYEKEKLMEYLGLEEEMLEEMLEEYVKILLESIPERLEKMDVFLTQNKRIEFKNEIHKLKGTISFLGVEQIFYLGLVEIEKLLKEKKENNKEEIEMIFKEIKIGIKELELFYEKELLTKK